MAIFHFPSLLHTPIPRPVKAPGFPVTHDSQNQYRSFLVQLFEEEEEEDDDDDDFPPPPALPVGSRRSLLHLAQLMRRPSPKTAAGSCCCSFVRFQIPQDKTDKTRQDKIRQDKVRTGVEEGGRMAERGWVGGDGTSSMGMCG